MISGGKQTAGRSKHPVLGQLPLVLESFRDGESITVGFNREQKVLRGCLVFSFCCKA